MSSVWAVVVTHNRREKLRECLSAIAAQRRRPDTILVVDNASTDGTGEMVERDYGQVELLALSTNRGGAGGFRAGLEHSHAHGADWIWLLDDDTIAEADALAELLSASERLANGRHAPMLFASLVLWRDGTAHPLNFPTLERRRMELVVEGAEHGVSPMRAATFVSLLLNRETVDRYRLPLEHYFIWSDDIEYTSRVVLGGDRAWFVPTSVVLHDTATAGDCMTAAPDRFYFHARNTLLMAFDRSRPPRDRALRVWVFLSTAGTWLLRRRDAAGLSAVARAVRDALAMRGEPRTTADPAARARRSS